MNCMRKKSGVMKHYIHLLDIQFRIISFIDKLFHIYRFFVFSMKIKCLILFFIFLGKPLKIKNCHLGKFGAVVEFKQTKNGGNQKLTPPSVIGHQLCQHIVGMNPKSIGSSDEKPNENKEEESQLIYQELLVDPEITVGEMLSENNVTVADFVRFEIGEEIPEESVKNEETASVL